VRAALSLAEFGVLLAFVGLLVPVNSLPAGRVRTWRARLRPGTATVGDLLDRRGNSIGLVRLLLAALVVVHHTRLLGGFGPDSIGRFSGNQMDLGILAVAGFFVLSGFLVTRSALRAPTTARYLWHRVLRVMPAYWVCLLMATLVFGPLFWLQGHPSLSGYLAVPVAPPITYVTDNVWLMPNQTRIDHLLADNPYSFTINGSLWTLPYEFAWYLLVALLAATGLLHRSVAVLAVIGIALLAVVTDVAPFAGIPVLGYAFESRFGLAFGLGMLAYVWRDRIPLDDHLAALATLAFILTLRTGTFATVGMTSLAYLVLWASWRLPFQRFGSRHDLSYGLYIYAFPVQQTIALLIGTTIGPLLFFLASLAGALPLAFLSWVAIERPALNAKSWHWRLGRGAGPVPAALGGSAPATPARRPFDPVAAVESVADLEEP
jgi:peptidoglycan/LPS O-acetylase OafA/YrhL